MTIMLDRDALLARLRDDPPGHLRALHARGNEGAAGLFPGILGALAYLLAREPERVALEDFAEHLWMFLGTPEDESNAGEADRELLLALTWWLTNEARDPSTETTTWDGGERGGWREVRGDLVVEGDLELVGAQLFVSGDVRVRGALTSERSSTLVTGGHVHAGYAVAVRGQSAVFVGGCVDAPLVTHDPTRTRLMEGIRALVLAEESPGWSRGMSAAPGVRARLMQLDQAPGGPDARLRAILHPDVLRACTATLDATLDLDSPQIWDELWPMLFASGSPLDALFTHHALEAFLRPRDGANA